MAAHIYVSSGHAMARKGSQSPLQQQLGNEVVESSYHHAKLHARANQVALKSLTSCCLHRQRSAAVAAGRPAEGRWLLPRKGGCAPSSRIVAQHANASQTSAVETEARNQAAPVAVWLVRNAIALYHRCCANERQTQGDRWEVATTDMTLLLSPCKVSFLSNWRLGRKLTKESNVVMAGMAAVAACMPSSRRGGRGEGRRTPVVPQLAPYTSTLPLR